MINGQEIEHFLIRASDVQFVYWCIDQNIVLAETLCPVCNLQMKLEQSKQFSGGHCWRCHNKLCTKKHGRYPFFFKSFFKSFGGNIKTLIICILRLAGNQPSKSILKTVKISEPRLIKLKAALLERMKIENFNLGKLGEVGKIVQVDETMMNYKAKSHRGRSAINKTDALCLVEVDLLSKKIEKVWAEVIPNKQADTILPIIKDHVIAHSVIYTDEHKSYQRLSNLGYEHKTVCHKANFVDVSTGVHTQNVESFNNCLKYQIKLRKGIKTEKRPDFLIEFIWKWNNKIALLESYFRIIKIN